MPVTIDETSKRITITQDYLTPVTGTLTKTCGVTSV